MTQEAAVPPPPLVSDLLTLFAGVIAGFILARALPFRKAAARDESQGRGAELVRAREAIRRLEAELEAVRRRPREDSAELLADNAELRRRMDELADALLARGQPAATPVPDAVAPENPAR